jgi:signal transduction histidine kinase
MTHRLYLRIYLAILASLLLTAILIGAAWRFAFDPARHGAHLDVIAEIATEILPPNNAPKSEQQAALDRWHRRAETDLALLNERSEILAAAFAHPLPPLSPSQNRSGWIHGERGPPAFALKLDDGRWLLARRAHWRSRAPFGFAATVALIALGVGLGAYPVVRRLTRRLERLQDGVEALGSGQLSARVSIKGKDEVAQLATSFNASAARIEQLVNAQKTLLANASHELRSPLARIRMALETQSPDANTRNELQQNIHELDQLIDEILTASRLDSPNAETLAMEEVDLTALVAEECARFNVELEAKIIHVEGDAKLLRRLVRNLLENARRYGGVAIDVSLKNSNAETVRLEVCDRGVGVPESEREKIFEPFYRMPGASERDGSVGLGLSLVKQIAEKHRGRVECISRDGGGTCFRVLLPYILPTT